MGSGGARDLLYPGTRSSGSGTPGSTVEAFVILRRTRFPLLLAGIAIGGALLLTPAQPTAQSADPLPVMSRQRALAFTRAAEQKLDYLPGEVLVKFTIGHDAGAAASGVVGAGAASRRRPISNGLARSRCCASATDPDAPFIASVLIGPTGSRCPPNQITCAASWRRRAIPPFSRQWNFTALGFAQSVGHQPRRANANTIVAVVDTGVTTVNQSFRCGDVERQRLQSSRLRSRSATI